MRSEIGNDQRIDLSVQFHYDNRDSLNIRNRPETGGGARLDIGCYALWVADVSVRGLKMTCMAIRFMKWGRCAVIRKHLVS